jgi:hypothetical protein
VAKCSECGFLTLRDKCDGSLLEVTDDYRVSGKVPSFLTGEAHNYPICFVMAYNLMPEVEQAAQQQFTERNEGWSDWPEYVLKIITKERDCDVRSKMFVTYQQGFTPKEHREMLDRQWLIANQNKREREDRLWREQQRIEDLQWRETQEEKAEHRHRTDLIIIGIVATLLICAVTIMAAFIERGSLFP